MKLRNRARLIRLTLIVTFALLGGTFFLHRVDEYPPSPKDNIFYVSSKGNDKNNGTFEHPWKTIQKAADTLKPGETVYVRKGIYKEFVHIVNSGSKGLGFITYKAYPGEVPVLDGKRLDMDGDQSALVYIDNASYVAVDGFEIRNLRAKSPDQFPDGILVDGGASNIHLLNNNIHHIEHTSKLGNAHGILFYGNSKEEIKDIRIEKNEIHHLKLGTSEALTLNGNVNGFSISQNKVHHNNNIGIDVAGFYETCEELGCVDQVRNGTITHNQVYANSSKKNRAYKEYSAAGIYVDGATNITIEQNHVFHNDFGIELASEIKGKQTSHVNVRINIIYNNSGAGIILGGASEENGGAFHNHIGHNLFYFNDQQKEGYGEITLQWHTAGNTFIQNFIYTHSKNEGIQRSGKQITDDYFIQNKTYLFK